MFSVEVTKNVEKYLNSIPKKMKEAFKEQLLVLEDSPREKGLTLKGEFRGLYRIKLSYKGVSYRAIYEVDDKVVKVLILLIDKREQIYEKAKNRNFVSYRKRYE